MISNAMGRRTCDHDTSVGGNKNLEYQHRESHPTRGLLTSAGMQSQSSSPRGVFRWNLIQKRSPAAMDPRIGKRIPTASTLFRLTYVMIAKWSGLESRQGELDESPSRKVVHSEIQPTGTEIALRPSEIHSDQSVSARVAFSIRLSCRRGPC